MERAMTYDEGMELACARLDLARAQQDLALMAAGLCRTAEFGDWLLEQDVSSAVMRGPQGKIKKVLVENQDDLTLALAFIASRAG
jgi:hypothetical protein